MYDVDLTTRAVIVCLMEIWQVFEICVAGHSANSPHERVVSVQDILSSLVTPLYNIGSGVCNLLPLIYSK